MSDQVTKACSVPPPTEIFERATTATSESFMIPRKFHGGWVIVQAETLDVHIRVAVAKSGGTAPTATLSATSTVSANEIAAAANGSDCVFAGTEKHFDLTKLVPNAAGSGDNEQRIWLAHISTGTSGRVRFRMGSGKGS